MFEQGNQAKGNGELKKKDDNLILITNPKVSSSSSIPAEEDSTMTSIPKSPVLPRKQRPVKKNLLPPLQIPSSDSSLSPTESFFKPLPSSRLQGMSSLPSIPSSPISSMINGNRKHHEIPPPRNPWQTNRRDTPRPNFYLF